MLPFCFIIIGTHVMFRMLTQLVDDNADRYLIGCWITTKRLNKKQKWYKKVFIGQLSYTKFHFKAKYNLKTSLRKIKNCIAYCIIF